jgi:hypothetical protein
MRTLQTRGWEREADRHGDASEVARNVETERRVIALRLVRSFVQVQAIVFEGVSRWSGGLVLQGVSRFYPFVPSSRIT